MALRFRKSFKLAPGVRMNLSGSGASWTVGPRGASIGIGKRGTYLNTGIPGTGLSARQRIGGGTSKTRKQSTIPSIQTLSIAVEISDNGIIRFVDNAGNELSEKLVRVAKRQHGEKIKELIQKKCDEINQEIDSIGEIHLYTPSPLMRPAYIKAKFEEPVPIEPLLKKPSIIRSFFKSHRNKIESQNQAAISEYHTQLKLWETRKTQFELHETDRKRLIEELIYTIPEAMSQFLEESLQEIVWPRETTVSTEILSNGRIIFIDVDLPEIEDMPNRKAAVPANGYKLSVKELSASNIHKLYMQHIHAIAFRIIGETFSSLPHAEEVVLSGYSQRPNKATGHIGDEYLLSVRVKRIAWSELAFDNLASIDATESLARFELRRSMSKTGIFKPIEPYSPDELIKI